MNFDKIITKRTNDSTLIIGLSDSDIEAISEMHQHAVDLYGNGHPVSGLEIDLSCLNVVYVVIDKHGTVGAKLALTVMGNSNILAYTDQTGRIKIGRVSDGIEAECDNSVVDIETDNLTEEQVALLKALYAKEQK